MAIEKQVELQSILYSKKCRKCDRWVEKGDWAMWFPDSSEVECAECNEEIT